MGERSAGDACVAAGAVAEVNPQNVMDWAVAALVWGLAIAVLGGAGFFLVWLWKFWREKP